MTSEETEGQQTNETAQEELSPAPEDLEKALAEAQKKVGEYLDNWKRSQADYANLKKRTDQEKQDTVKFGNTQLIMSLLPVLDDFERAFNHPPHKQAKHEWVEGIKLIETKFRAALHAYGVIQIDAVGKPFDPNLHEACLRAPGEDGIVVKELSTGYKLSEKVIRPTQAIVGNGEKEKGAES